MSVKLPKTVRFSRFKHIIKFNLNPHQRSLNVGKRLESFIHFLMIREVRNGKVVQEYVFPYKISKQGGEKEESNYIWEEDTPRMEKFYLEEDVTDGYGKNVMYRVYDTEPKTYRPLTKTEEKTRNVSELVVFVRDGSKLKLVPFKSVLGPRVDISIFESKRRHGRHFLHDDKFGMYYPLTILEREV
jgi:hypothetical protein